MKKSVLMFLAGVFSGPILIVVILYFAIGQPARNQAREGVYPDLSQSVGRPLQSVVLIRPCKYPGLVMFYFTEPDDILESRQLKIVLLLSSDEMSVVEVDSAWQRCFEEHNEEIEYQIESQKNRPRESQTLPPSS